jgi:T5SS/PEP-CTERM-associated repeat protein
MAVTYTGDNIFDANSIPTQIGDTGVGSLVVNGGSTETWANTASGNGPFVQIGAQAGSNGSVRVSGPGASIEMIGTGDFNTGMHIGAAGTGTFLVRNGASLDLQGSPTATIDEVGFTVGRVAGGDGPFTRI